MIDFARFSRYNFALLPFMIFALISPALADIKVIVNDDLITTLDIEQGLKAKLARSKEVRKAMVRQFKSKSTKEKWRQMVMTERPTSREEAQALQKKLAAQIKRDVARRFKGKLRKSVLNDLIDERLKYQAAKKNNMLISKEDAEKMMARLAANNKHPKTGKPLTLSQFKQALRSQGVSYNALKKRLRIGNSWQRYIYSKFGRQVSVTEKEIQNLMTKQKTSPKKAVKSSSTTQVKILKVSFVFPQKAKSSQADKTKRVVEATNFHKKGLSSCSKIVQNAALQSNVKIKYINNGLKYAKIRKAVKNKSSGQLSGPVMFNDFVALYAKCGGGTKKSVVKSGDPAKRAKVEAFLKKKAISRLAKRHLRDLRQDANIEYR